MSLKPGPSEWALNVTNTPNVCFCPCIRDSIHGNSIAFDLPVFTDYAPGRLVCVVHEGGQEILDKWLSANPDWQKRYGPKRHHLRTKKRWGMTRDILRQYRKIIDTSNCITEINAAKESAIAKLDAAQDATPTWWTFTQKSIYRKILLYVKSVLISSARDILDERAWKLLDRALRLAEKPDGPGKTDLITVAKSFSRAGLQVLTLGSFQRDHLCDT